MKYVNMKICVFRFEVSFCQRWIFIGKKETIDQLSACAKA